MAEDVIEIIKKAIRDEKQAQEDYLRGAEAAEDPETQAIFEQLARDEEEHEQMLRDRLAGLRLIKKR